MRRRGAGSTARREPSPRSWAARPRSCRCSRTRAGSRSRWPARARGSCTWTPPAPPPLPRGGGGAVPGAPPRPALAGARRNAELSGLADAPIRWLADDARAFAKRERRRGRHYDAIVLDPPSYGHGTGAWHIDSDLVPLLEDLAALSGPRPAFALLSAHTPGYDGERLGALVREHLGVGAHDDELVVRSRSGSSLRLGSWAHGPYR